MKVGFAGPVSLRMLARHVNQGETLPRGYEFPATALWVEELLRRGYEVTLFSLAREVVKPVHFVGPQLEIHVGRYRERHRARDFFHQEREDLRVAMEKSDCDIIHAHWTYEFALAALASGKRTLITAHDAPFRVLRFVPDAYRLVRLLMAFRVARRAPTMTAVSNDIATHFRHYFGYKGQLVVIPNFLPASIFDAGRDVANTRSTGTVTFATVLVGWGRLKNACVALRAFRRVRERLPDTRLLMFGEGFEPGGSAHRWAQALGLYRGVEFIGRVPHDVLITRLAKDVDVLVHPSLEEALSVTVMEGMALGLPIIAGAKTPGMAFLLENGDVGRLVDMRSHTELAEVIVHLAEDADERRRLGEAARLSALRRLHAEVVLPAFERLYAAMTS